MARIRLVTHPKREYTDVMICSGNIPWLKDWIKERQIPWGLERDKDDIPGFRIGKGKKHRGKRLVRELVTKLLEEGYTNIKIRRTWMKKWRKLESVDDCEWLFKKPKAPQQKKKQGSKKKKKKSQQKSPQNKNAQKRNGQKKAQPSKKKPAAKKTVPIPPEATAVLERHSLATTSSGYRRNLLARMKEECEYWLDAGFDMDNKADEALWAKDPCAQTCIMKALYESLPEGERPEGIDTETIEMISQNMDGWAVLRDGMRQGG